MSKAKEWAKRLEGFIEEHEPSLRDGDDEILASVDDYGMLQIKRRHDWTAEQALTLARWILATFAEDEGALRDAEP